MTRLGIAIVLGSSLLLAGCGGSSVNDLAHEKFGDGAGHCRESAMTTMGQLYSCQNGKGSTVCVARNGDTLLVVTPEEVATLGRVSC